MATIVSLLIGPIDSTICNSLWTIAKNKNLRNVYPSQICKNIFSQKFLLIEYAPKYSVQKRECCWTVLNHLRENFTFYSMLWNIRFKNVLLNSFKSSLMSSTNMYKNIHSQGQISFSKSLSKSFGTSHSELKLTCICIEVNVPSFDWLMSITISPWCPWCFPHSAMLSYSWVNRNLWPPWDVMAPLYLCSKQGQSVHWAELKNFERDFHLKKRLHFLYHIWAWY